MPNPGLRRRAHVLRHWTVVCGWPLVAVYVVGFGIALAGVWAWSHSTLAQLPVAAVAFYVRMHLDWDRVEGVRLLASRPKWLGDWLFVPVGLALYVLLRGVADSAGYYRDPLLILYSCAMGTLVVVMLVSLGATALRRSP